MVNMPEASLCLHGDQCRTQHSVVRVLLPIRMVDVVVITDE
jgi:hypothetical protein